MLEESFFLGAPFNMYCERIVPTHRRFPFPIVMVHGVAHTGACYKTKPDGKRGWAYFFAEQGFEVCVLDWPATGRSGVVPFERITGAFMVEAIAALVRTFKGKVILLTHSMSGPYGWKVAELLGNKIVMVIGVAPGEMGNISSEPHVVSRHREDVTVRMAWGDLHLNLREWLQNDDAFVRKKLIGESRQFPCAHLEAYVASLQPRHPRLTFERLNIDGSQLRIDPKKLRETKVLVVTGTNDADHTRDIDGRIVTFLKQHGVDAEFLWLGDQGMTGNGHMLMLERNSDQISAAICSHIKRALK